jgi:hypothetical protein
MRPRRLSGRALLPLSGPHDSYTAYLTKSDDGVPPRLGEPSDGGPNHSYTQRATVLSGNGDHPMTKLSDTQAVILTAASQRNDGAVPPLPDTLKIKGGAVDKVLGSLKAKGLIDHFGTPRGDNPPPLRITRAGLEAIGVDTEDDASEGATLPDTGATSADAGGQAIDAAAPVTEADGAVARAKRTGPYGPQS